MIAREHIEVRGIVQGVGFRPFIFKLAEEHGLRGFVLNDSRGVEIEVEGDADDIERFASEIRTRRPVLAHITELHRRRVAPAGDTSFTIKESLSFAGRTALISPDTATCLDCRRELLDETDRRYLYPFINCTNCGPRYTIVRDIPYDRPATSMAKFQMCGQCEEEYHDPRNRRFHAQPNACWDCGPQLVCTDPSGRVLWERDAAVQEAIAQLRAGAIVAIKGLGGFHLAVDATNHEAVRRLRRRKFREEKPLAVMSRDVDTVRSFCEPTAAHVQLLESVQKPIVLIPKKQSQDLSPDVAPHRRHFGVMLPYTPLHHLLLRAGFVALVMTSGNQTDEPIATGNEEALVRLGGIADYFLMHERDILVRCDDSVVTLMAGQQVMFRRARGYVPRPVFLPVAAREPILAVGAELKNTVCLVKDDKAFLGQHIGDLENLLAKGFFEEVIGHLSRILEVEPSIVAYDLHPDYLSTRYAKLRRGVQLIGVQHHHAHIASCMAEHGLTGDVLGLAFDGTGYGLDGSIWGSEFLVANERELRRMGHLEAVPMPGGDKCVEEPARMAYAYLYRAFGRNMPSGAAALLARLGEEQRRVLGLMMERGVNSPISCGLGRLFDAVSAILGICLRRTYEGQPAIELEAAASPDETGEYKYEVLYDGRQWILRPGPTLEGLLKDVASGAPADIVSARFHNTLVTATADMCQKIGETASLRRVVMSGGVFQNHYLTERLVEALHRMGFETYLHRDVPPGDGCIALGQAYVASARSSDNVSGDPGKGH